MLSKLASLIFLIFLMTLALHPIVEAKPSIDLEFYKNNGYGIGNDIGGVWTITAVVSSNVQYVEFYLDNQLQQNDTSKPFSWQLDTINYAAGSHTIKAIAYDASGESAFLQVERNFQQTTTQTITAILIAAVTATIIIAVGFAIYKTQKTKKHEDSKSNSDS
jgi:hypothetical protein